MRISLVDECFGKLRKSHLRIDLIWLNGKSSHWKWGDITDISDYSRSNSNPLGVLAEFGNMIFTLLPKVILVVNQSSFKWHLWNFFFHLPDLPNITLATLPCALWCSGCSTSAVSVDTHRGSSSQSANILIFLLLPVSFASTLGSLSAAYGLKKSHSAKVSLGEPKKGPQSASTGTQNAKQHWSD